MTGRFLRAAALLVLAASAAAQRPVWEPDDFIDPGIRTGTVFISRVAAGRVWNPTDRYRPFNGDAGVVLLTNSVYRGNVQFDYVHTETLAEDAPAVQRCDCPGRVYFPTPPPAGAAPAALPAGRSDALKLAFYRTSSDGAVYRYQFRWKRQPIDTEVTSPATRQVVERRSGRDQSFVLDADTRIRIRGRNLWGSLYVARASRSGTPYDQAQHEFGYVSRFSGFRARSVLFLPKLTIGAISGRGATGLNVINPSIEAFWRHRASKVNVHVVWSPQATRSGEGWNANHEIAVFADRTLLLHVFGR
jgi:hypothetical protein